MTKYEKYMYDMVQESYSHMTAEQIYQKVRAQFPRVALATVYNNLNKLCTEGLVRRISIKGMPDMYDRNEKHDHLVCQDCGKLSDMQFEDITDSLKKQLGSGFLSYDLKVIYLCPD